MSVTLTAKFSFHIFFLACSVSKLQTAQMDVLNLPSKKFYGQSITSEKSYVLCENSMEIISEKLDRKLRVTRGNATSKWTTLLIIPDSLPKQLPEIFTYIAVMKAILLNNLKKTYFVYLLKRE